MSFWKQCKARNPAMFSSSTMAAGWMKAASAI
jgi:hypothetical protein